MSKKTKNKKKRTRIAIVLDRSGSMASNKEQTVMAYNEQVQEIKLNSNEDNEVFGSLITFNGSVFEHLWNEPANKLEEATVESYMPGGSTALNDAIGYTIDKLEETSKDDDGDTAFLVIIISDGEENASQRFSPEDINKRISKHEEAGNWTFTYMGCDRAKVERVAKTMGLKMANAACWDNTSTSAVAGSASPNLRAGTQRYLRARTAGSQQVNCLYSDKADAIGDFTQLDAVDMSALYSSSGAPVAQLNTLSGSSAIQLNASNSAKADVFLQGSAVQWKA